MQARSAWKPDFRQLLGAETATRLFREARAELRALRGPHQRPDEAKNAGFWRNCVTVAEMLEKKASRQGRQPGQRARRRSASEREPSAELPDGGGTGVEIACLPALGVEQHDLVVDDAILDVGDAADYCFAMRVLSQSGWWRCRWGIRTGCRGAAKAGAMSRAILVRSAEGCCSFWASSPGKALLRMAVRSGPGLTRFTAHGRGLHPERPTGDQRLKRGLARRIDRPVGQRVAGRAGRDKQRPARIGLAQQQVERADQPMQFAVTLSAKVCSKSLGDMGNGRQHAQRAGIGDKPIEPAPALETGGAEPIDRLIFTQVGRHQCRRAPDAWISFVPKTRPHGTGNGD